MTTLRITLLITVILPLYYELCSCQCAPAEYEINGECCPMCAPGNRVLWHCTHDTATTCAPCPEYTYIDEPSGLSECLTCTECDLKRGLRVSKACTRSSDAVCEPLERFFCTDPYKHTCRLAVQHSECRPGQYIRQAGTGSTDTVCADCKADTYSDGSLSSCKPHTKCKALGLTEITPGTQSSDSECGNLSAVTAIAVSVTVTVIVIITVISVLTVKHMRKKRQSHQSERGLRVSKACTRSSDTVCEPLERFFCTDPYKHTCRLAVQHSECRPGQYIRQAGTGSTDTVCADCKADTYSDGSLSSCKPHTKCKALGLTEITPGTQSSDSECGNLSAVTAIAVSVTVTVIVIITVISVLTVKHMRKKRQSHQSGNGK